MCISALAARAQDVPPRPVVVAYPNAAPGGGRGALIGGGETPKPAPAIAEPQKPPPPPVIPVAPDPGLQPSWETQKLARNYSFAIPAPRGQIVDRNGVPLAQTRVAYNLAISFPTPPQFTDEEATRFIAEKVRHAQDITGRVIKLDPARALKQYKDRGVMPLVIA